ncbi:hypothetical protein EVAR_70366_1 [Eumeta japonica]|uniref:Uncharacterized protein n=1 Tax=Eumeta variegata TaxID=151549 RepID=A0A4C1THS1_EUMVA|nr:hypothetical protein EVAR_70366_1 [Eumeta japonica]
MCGPIYLTPVPVLQFEITQLSFKAGDTWSESRPMTAGVVDGESMQSRHLDHPQTGNCELLMYRYCNDGRRPVQRRHNEIPSPRRSGSKPPVGSTLKIPGSPGAASSSIAAGTNDPTQILIWRAFRTAVAQTTFIYRPHKIPEKNTSTAIYLVLGNKNYGQRYRRPRPRSMKETRTGYGAPGWGDSRQNYKDKLRQ